VLLLSNIHQIVVHPLLILLLLSLIVVHVVDENRVKVVRVRVP